MFSLTRVYQSPQSRALPDKLIFIEQFLADDQLESAGMPQTQDR